MNLMGKLRQMLGDDEIQRKPQIRATARPAQRMGAYEDGSGVKMGQRRILGQGIPLQGNRNSMGNADNLYSRQPLEAAPDSADAFQPVFQQPTMNTRTPVQPAMQTYWQNTDGMRRNMINPQFEQDDYNYLDY